MGRRTGRTRERYGRRNSREWGQAGAPAGTSGVPEGKEEKEKKTYDSESRKDNRRVGGEINC